MPRPALPLLALALCAGCAHTVTFDSEPRGAEVEVDGYSIGRTPVAFVDRGGLKRTYAIKLTKPGYQARSMLITQQARFPTVCCPATLLWAWELPEDGYLWRLDEDHGEGPPPPPGFLPPDPSQAPRP